MVLHLPHFTRPKDQGRPAGKADGGGVSDAVVEPDDWRVRLQLTVWEQRL
ncbi:hypothetical protein QFZ40_000018 [Arthrobacter pascens]|nr:hypothetical protein [Arthrobacter pascens]MDQ0632109.1 hypothetical protein [Arthrobacter pascens]